MKLTFDTHGNDKQKQCAAAWVNPEITDIYYGGAKGGAKSYTGANLIFHDAHVYAGTHYFIARKKLNDLRKFTLPTIYEVHENWNIKASDYFKFNGQDNLFEFKNGSRVFLLEGAYQPSDPLYSRFGSMQMTRGWVEEAGDFAKEAKSNLAASIGRWKNDEYNLKRKLLQTGNPAKNYTYSDYYKPYKNGVLQPHQVFIQAFPQDNKMLPDGYITQLEQTLSANEKQRLLYGNWEYDDNPAALCEYEKILDVFTNTHVPEGDRFVTVDIARMGGDKIVIIEWNGWRGKVKYYTKQTLDVTSTYIQTAMRRNFTGNSNTLLDSDGMGGGPVDFLKVKGFTNNARPLPSPERFGSDPENFDNLKSQCYFRLAERINKNGIYLECEDEQIKAWIIQELEQIQQKSLDSDMKKGVLSKDKVKELIGRSPDFSDTIMMREYFELKPKKELVWA